MVGATEETFCGGCGYFLKLHKFPGKSAGLYMFHNICFQLIHFWFVCTQSLLNMLDIKCLHGDIHRTYNMHDALYNSRVIEKALEMLSNRYLR